MVKSKLMEKRKEPYIAPYVPSFRKRPRLLGWLKDKMENRRERKLSKLMWKELTGHGIIAALELNPHSFKFFCRKPSEMIAKFNKFGGSLDKHQFSGPEFRSGPKLTPKDCPSDKTSSPIPRLTEEEKRVYRNRAVEVAASSLHGAWGSFGGIGMQESLSPLHFMWNNPEHLPPKVFPGLQMKSKMSKEAIKIVEGETGKEMHLVTPYDLGGLTMNPFSGLYSEKVRKLHRKRILKSLSRKEKKEIEMRAGKKIRHMSDEGLKTWWETQVLRRMIKEAEKEVKSKDNAPRAETHMLHMVVYCPRCETPGRRGTRCQNDSCDGGVLY
jgi:hypothetical protein